MTYRIVQPWGQDRARQATVVSVHNTAAEAFAEIDRLAIAWSAPAIAPDAVELIVVDDAANVVTRPGTQ